MLGACTITVKKELHTATYLQVDVGEEYFLVAVINDCRMIGACKDIGGA